MFINKLWSILAISGLFLSLSCKDVDPIEPKSDTYYIMSIGDSRIDGARPDFESYRYEFWKNMVDSDYKFDLVGPFTDKDHSGNYDEYKGQEFDDDHAGIGGDKTTNVLDRLEEALDVVIGGPDIVLLGIGGNDILEGGEVNATIDNLNQIIDAIQAKNSNVVILLEEIAPGKTAFMTTEFTTKFNEYNAEIPAVASAQSTGDSQVIVVDMTPGWQDSYLADDVHYNETGAKIIADRYYTALQINVPTTK